MKAFYFISTIFLLCCINVMGLIPGGIFFQTEKNNGDVSMGLNSKGELNTFFVADKENLDIFNLYLCNFDTINKKYINCFFNNRNEVYSVQLKSKEKTGLKCNLDINNLNMVNGYPSFKYVRSQSENLLALFINFDEDGKIKENDIKCNTLLTFETEDCQFEFKCDSATIQKILE